MLEACGINEREAALLITPLKNRSKNTTRNLPHINFLHLPLLWTLFSLKPNTYKPISKIPQSPQTHLPLHWNNQHQDLEAENTEEEEEVSQEHPSSNGTNSNYKTERPY
jgi:hypothetical protein